MRTLKHRDLTICLRTHLGRAKVGIKSDLRLVREPTILVKVTQSCPTLWDPIQVGILEWVTFSFSRGSSQPRDRTQVSRIAGRFFTSWATREAQEYWSGEPIPLQWIFPIQEANWGLLHCRRILYQLSYQGSHFNHYTIMLLCSVALDRKNSTR